MPGNHELWLRGDTRDRVTYPDSWAKLMALKQVGGSIGIGGRGLGYVADAVGNVGLPIQVQIEGCQCMAQRNHSYNSSSSHIVANQLQL